MEKETKKRIIERDISNGGEDKREKRLNFRGEDRVSSKRDNRDRVSSKRENRERVKEIQK